MNQPNPPRRADQVTRLPFIRSVVHRWRLAWSTRLTTLGLVAVLSSSSLALAQSYGPAQPRGFKASDDGRVRGPILGAGNLFGYSSSTTEVALEGEDLRSETSQVSFLGGGLGNPYALPGLSLDAVLGRGFTVGGALRYASTTGKTADVSVSSSQFALAVRLGGFFGGQRLAIWPRLGLVYQSAGGSAFDLGGVGKEGGFSSSALSLELPVVFRGRVVGMGIGPALFLSLGGDTTVPDLTSTASSGARTEASTALGAVGVAASLYVFP